MEATIEAGWKQVLQTEFDKPYYQELSTFVDDAYQHKTIYPPKEQVFKAFDLCPFERTKVVILGQDPYHGPGQAHGLCFSVNKGIKIPPSLLNIYKELNQDVGFIIPDHGNLEQWAKQGVLLLNATLTVEAHKAGSHQKKGWETFTDHVIQTIAEQSEHVVFLLWGAYAQKKAKLIDETKHCILSSVHPSPLSAYRGFLGNQHFSQTNKYLTSKGKEAIEWQLQMDSPKLF
ncbi:uracil-DNA glycosylase [Carboxylicivirga sp. M1479]|uniref:uracil-DNA glycosylase n=1 Tax=Carboxylicivirga sp. M1479 TaxID=2594476 RepID=UPI00117759D1|nr:uracil-DNA glycosylase [Carboxylicivirga sp. M1479]TRX72188.1 uracil-DNA glycosylase [Carboxylicivirga sp. M1479]